MDAMQEHRPIAARGTKLVSQTLPRNPTAVPLTDGRDASRVLPLITTVVALISHTLIAAMCTYLPQDLVGIQYGLIGYAISGYAVIVVYGILTVSISASPSTGVLAPDPQHQQDRRFTPLFPHFLLLIYLLWVCVELVVLELVFSITHDLGTCPSTISATFADPTQLSRIVNVSSESQREVMEAGSWCRYALRMIQIVSVCVLVCTCAVIGVLAVALRDYVWQTRSSSMQSRLIQFERYYKAPDGGKQTVREELVSLVDAQC